MVQARRKSGNVNEIDKAYVAGLFDGEGSVLIKQYWEKKRKDKPKAYKVWRINMEISMTDESVIRWVHEVLGVGTVRIRIKNKSPSSKPHWKKQWRWRCGHRDALYVAKLLWPHAQTKLHKMEQIIDHYGTEDEAKPSADIIYLKDKRK